MQVPGYLEKVDVLKQVGVDEVIVYCVNDGAVMAAWSKNQGVPTEGIMTMMGDPSGQVTAAFEMELDHPGPISVGLHGRCKRFALYAEDGDIKIVHVSESEDDPAGDDFPEFSCAPSMIEAIQDLKPFIKPEL